MRLSVVSSDFTGQKEAYITLLGIDYDKPMTLADLQKYLQTETGKTVEIVSGKTKDGTDVALTDSIFTPKSNNNEQLPTQLGIVNAKVDGTDVTIYVNNSNAGYTVMLGSENLGLFKAGMELTITGGKLIYTDPVSKTEVTKTIKGGYFTVKSGTNNNGEDLFYNYSSAFDEKGGKLSAQTTISTVTVNGTHPEYENRAAAANRDTRFFAVPDKSKAYTITVGPAVIITDNYWTYDATTLNSGANANALMYAHAGDTIELKDYQPQQGVSVVEIDEDGFEQDNTVSVSGKNPKYTFVMPEFNVKVADGLTVRSVTLDGKTISTKEDGKLNAADTKNLSGYVVITKDGKYFGHSAGAPGEVVASNRFISVSNLKKIAFDADGYEIETGYYKWEFDVNGDDTADYSNYVKSGTRVYVTADGTEDGTELSINGTVSAVTKTSETAVRVTKNGDLWSFTMPAEDVVISHGGYKIKVVGKGVGGTFYTTQDGKLSEDDIKTDGTWGKFVTITTVESGGVTKYWKNNGGTNVTGVANVAQRYIPIENLKNIVLVKDTGTPAIDDDMFTVNVGYYKIESDTTNKASDVFTVGGTAFAAGADGYARAGETVEVTSLSTLTGTAVKNADGKVVAEVQHPSGTTFKFKMPDCNAVFVAGANYFNIDVADAVTGDVESVSTNTTGRLVPPAGSDWGTYATIIAKDGDYYTVNANDTLTKNTKSGLEANPNLKYVPVSALKNAVFTSAVIDQDITVTTGFYKVSFTVTGSDKSALDKTTVNGTEILKWGLDKDGNDIGAYVKRGEKITIAVGAMNQFKMNETNYKAGDTVELVAGTDKTECALTVPEVSGDLTLTVNFDNTKFSDVTVGGNAGDGAEANRFAVAKDAVSFTLAATADTVDSTQFIVLRDASGNRLANAAADSESASFTLDGISENTTYSLAIEDGCQITMNDTDGSTVSTMHYSIDGGANWSAATDGTPFTVLKNSTVRICAVPSATGILAVGDDTTIHVDSAPSDGDVVGMTIVINDEDTMDIDIVDVKAGTLTGLAVTAGTGAITAPTATDNGTIEYWVVAAASASAFTATSDAWTINTSAPATITGGTKITESTVIYDWSNGDTLVAIETKNGKIVAYEEETINVTNLGALTVTVDETTGTVTVKRAGDKSTVGTVKYTTSATNNSGTIDKDTDTSGYAAVSDTVTPGADKFVIAVEIVGGKVVAVGATADKVSA